ncbi:MAG TPA: cysteine--tRNA ligase [Ktedonobacteraceae bacterium]|nr:cysteine--tRNA ligase [Ktedonobacteraceae bacterium]
MRLFNTITQSLEEFVPQDKDNVRIYVCGVTPYDTTHLGHAFTYVSFDNLIRYLEFTGNTVFYVQNVTNIDDDILRKARELHMAWDELGDRETERFLNDMDALNVRRPNVYARATDEIPYMQEIIQGLLAGGYAYESGGNVYFSVNKAAGFDVMPNAIGLHSYQAMLEVANERGNFPDDPHKRDPLDFVLWQAQAPGEPAWESPWGPGRPGWHIECSAMSMHYLGPELDIHGGGADLAFPHHTCEIAQSVNYTDHTPFSRFWMHSGMVYQDGEKMSKSLGNLTLVSEMLKQYSADAIRIVLASHHYREPWEMTEDDLKKAQKTEQLFKQVGSLVDTRTDCEDMALRERFTAAMDDDLNTPEALRILRQAAEMAINSGNVGLGAEVLRLAKVLGLRG